MWAHFRQAQTDLSSGSPLQCVWEPCRPERPPCHRTTPLHIKMVRLASARPPCHLKHSKRRHASCFVSVFALHLILDMIKKVLRQRAMSSGGRQWMLLEALSSEPARKPCWVNMVACLLGLDDSSTRSISTWLSSSFQSPHCLPASVGEA